jgi:hypothetical protein
MKHVVMYSGGVGSWATAKRVAEKHGTAGMVLLFADTLIEDEDLYRFLDQSSAKLGVPITRLCDGRTPWEVCEKERIIANSRIDPCSRVLKRELLDKWRNENCTPHNTVIYVGIDWTEKHRLDRLQKRVEPWRYEAPLISPPYRTKRELLAEMQADGIDLPRLYKWGFPHHNCGGFCFKAGHSAFALLLRHLPDRYREHEDWEEKMRGIVGDHSIMSDRAGDGVKKPLTMRQFRERIEANPGAPSLFNDDLAAGCGCALE